MSSPVLRIFSYLPNPRVWKALIAARLLGVPVEVTGDKPGALSQWLWDLEPRPLDEDERDPDGPHARQSRRGFGGTLYKTDAFLEAHPFGTVPAAFTPGGIGVFESNSILRAVARAANRPPLYGTNAEEASRVDSFLDANLAFAREAQVYLLGLRADVPDPSTHARMSGAYEFYLSGLEAALGRSPFLAGDLLSIADISFACDTAQFLREQTFADALNASGLGVISETWEADYPRCLGHLSTLCERPEFDDLKAYWNAHRSIAA